MIPLNLSVTGSFVSKFPIASAAWSSFKLDGTQCLTLPALSMSGLTCTQLSREESSSYPGKTKSLSISIVLLSINNVWYTLRFRWPKESVWCDLGIKCDSNDLSLQVVRFFHFERGNAKSDPVFEVSGESTLHYSGQINMVWANQRQLDPFSQYSSHTRTTFVANPVSVRINPKPSSFIFVIQSLIIGLQGVPFDHKIILHGRLNNTEEPQSPNIFVVASQTLHRSLNEKSFFIR